MPLRVLGATAYPLSVASARVRVAGFAPFLKTHAVRLQFRPALRDDEYGTLSSHARAPRKALVLARSAGRAMHATVDHDLLLVHRLRLLTPLPGLDPPPTLDLYDLDDSLFLGSASPVNRRFQWAKQEARRCIACLKRARLVIAGNRFLADNARRYAQAVEVVPSCIDPNQQSQRAHSEREVVTVGWIGSPTTGEYLQVMLRAFRTLNERRLRAKLVVIGADTGIRAAWIEHQPWSLGAERHQLANFDLGIMPLPDTPWTRGKCGYKLLQYFSAAVPAIASPVGVAKELVGEEHGLLAATTDEWRFALEQLISNVDERRQRGAAARDFVERHYSYQRWAPELAALLQSVAR